MQKDNMFRFTAISALILSGLSLGVYGYNIISTSGLSRADLETLDTVATASNTITPEQATVVVDRIENLNDGLQQKIVDQVVANLTADLTGEDTTTLDKVATIGKVADQLASNTGLVETASGIVIQLTGDQLSSGTSESESILLTNYNLSGLNDVFIDQDAGTDINVITKKEFNKLVELTEKIVVFFVDVSLQNNKLDLSSIPAGTLEVMQ